jgi:hypothetical protein
MIDRTPSRLLPRLAAWLAAAFALLTAVPAAAAGVCGIAGSAAAQGLTYNPFSPTGFPTATITLAMHRINPAGGAKTAVVNFYLQGQSPTTDGTTIVPTAISAASATADGLNQNIFTNFSATPPNLNLTPAGNHFLRINFTGNNAASDNASVTFQVTLPPNLDLAATQDLGFDVLYSCSGTGGGGPFTDSGRLVQAVTFGVTVLSVLQANYVGNLAFPGDMGTHTTAEVLAAPATYSTSGGIDNRVEVRSSGAYTVEMTAQNLYRMTFAGGNPATANQSLKYKILFLGQTVSNAAPTFSTVTCSRAGVATAEADKLPIRATLLEGGDTKLPASYIDVVTVTVTPLATLPASVDCPGIPLPAP